jgi:putative solute:sodium symporter small subunit
MSLTMPTDLPPPPSVVPTRGAHWQRTSRLTAVLLLIWLGTGFGTVFFARELAQFYLFDWPLSFYMAAQGSSLVSLALVAFYAWRMRRLDLRHAPGAEDGAQREGQP